MTPATTDMRAAIAAEVDRIADDIGALAAELIRVESPNPKLADDPSAALGGEGACTALLAERMREAGLAVTTVEAAAGRANAIGTLAGFGGGRSIVLNGHVDTVPADRAVWSVDPFGGVIRDGKVWGRGATDMKGAVASMVKAVEVLARLDVRVRGDVAVHAVVGEEMFDPEGAAAVLEAGHRPDACIVGEPTHAETGGAEIQVISAPVVWMRVTLRGRAAHSSLRYRWVHPGGDPELGVNAIEKAVDLVKTLQDLERQWGLRKAHPLFPPGKFTLHPGIIRGPVHMTTVPVGPAEQCVVEFTIWHHPDETAEQVQHEVADWIERWASFDPWLVAHPPELEWPGVFPNFAIEPGHELVRVVREAHRAVAGTPAPVTSMPGACDATFYAQMGVPVLVYGPGRLADAHTVDERVELAQLAEAAKVYALAAYNWCR